MKMRPYQTEAIDKLRESLRKGNKRVLLTLCTGAGKSIIARNIVEMAEKRNNMVLYTAHRNILVKQMKSTFKGLHNVVVETLQTSKGREHDDVKIIIADEVHYGVNSPMQEKVFAKYPNAIIIGMSATPVTAQGYKIEGWDDTIDIIQLVDLIELGYAAPLKILAPASVNRTNFKIQNGDYNQKDVSEEVTKSTIVQNVVQQYIRHADGLKAIFYCVNIDHAELINAELLAHGYKTSTYHSKLNDKEDIFERFKKNELTILCSVESLTTGVDLPDLYCGVLATPTKSIIKAVQIYGRFTRQNPADPNKMAIILDCANVIDDTVHPYDRLTFDKIPEKRATKCQCGGIKRIIKRETFDSGEFEIKVRTTHKCDTCLTIDVAEETKVLELNYCEKCENEIEKGSAKTETREEENKITVVSICPHCENEKIIREIELIDVEMQELKHTIDAKSINGWEDVERELRKATDKDGKKYHWKWAKIATSLLQGKDFTLDEVKNFIAYYTSKGWSLGGIVQAMEKRRLSQI